MSEPFIEIGEPRKFNRRFKLWSEAWPSLLLTVFVYFVISIATDIYAEDILIPLVHKGVSRSTRLLLLVAFGVVVFGLFLSILVFFIPTLARNPLIASWSQQQREELEAEGYACFVVDFILQPPVIGGFEKVVDEADDVGLLSLHPTHLQFDGDSIHAILPWSLFGEIDARRTNWRGAWVMGKDFHIRFLSPVEGREELKIRVREGRTILKTRERSQEMRGQLDHNFEETRLKNDY